MAEKKQFQLLKLSVDESLRFGEIRTLDEIKSLSAENFVHYCGHLYQQSGYTTYISQPVGAGGVDLLLRDGPGVTIVHCFPKSDVVDQLPLTDLYSTMVHNNAQQAVAITTGSFSAETDAWATNIPIDLVDGKELELWAGQMPEVVPPPPAPPQQDEAPRKRRRPARWVILLLLLLVAVVACSGITLLANNFYDLGSLFATDAEPTVAPPPTPEPTAIAEATEPAVEPMVEPTSTPEPTPTEAPAFAPTVTVVATQAPTIKSAVIASRFELPPSIDGDAAEWQNLPSFTAPFVTEREDTWDQTLDANTVWRLGWDDANLYIAVLVLDDTHVQTNETKFAYLGDSVELEFDIDLNGDYSTEVNADDFQYIVSPGDFGQIPAGIFRFQGDNAGLMSDAPGTQAEVVAVQLNGGYIMEITIPWSDMNATPAENMVIGAAFSVNDNDDPGTSKQELMMSHVLTRRWSEPASWGTLTLE